LACREDRYVWEAGASGQRGGVDEQVGDVVGGQCWDLVEHLGQLAHLDGVGDVAGKLAAAALGPDSLTRREREVARLAATGMSAKEIAGSLFVGERTVEGHLASVYAKLGVDSKLQLVRRAAEFGLL
jgi:DNA-binding CsgD family transcriptional regulator